MIVLEYSKKRQFPTVAFNGAASQLAAGGDYEPVAVWDIATGRELHRIDRIIARPTQALVFHPRAPWLYIAYSYGLTAFNTATGKLSELWEKDQFARNVAVDPTGRRLIGSRHQLRTGRSDLRKLTCLNATDADKPVKEWERTDNEAPNEGWTDLVAFFADGERFATAETSSGWRGYSPHLTVRAANTGEILRTLIGTGTEAEQLAVSPLGNALVVRVNRRLYVFDLVGRSAPPREIKNEGRKHFTGIAFHPSGRFLVATSNDATVKFYDSMTWELARTFTWEIGKMRGVAFSPDGTLAAAGSDTGKVVVWDVDL